MTKIYDRMWSSTFYAINVAGPFLFGHFLPKSDLFGGALNFVNIPWGSAFGTGWAIADAIGLGRVSILVGFILWPFVLMIALVMLAYRIRRHNWKIQGLFSMLMCATFFVSVSPQTVYSSSLSHLPIFWKYFERAS